MPHQRSVDTPNQSAVFVASHRRSGTHLTLDSLVANFDCFESGFQNFDAENCKLNAGLYKTHMDGNEASRFLNPESKVIYVVRDGRDVMVSLFNYAKTHDSSVRDMKFSEFLRSPNPYACSEEFKGLSRVAFWSRHVESWLSREDVPVQVVTFDGWKNSFRQLLSELGQFLEVSPKSTPKSMVMKPGQNWSKKLLRKVGLLKTTAIQFRGGRSDVWKEHFDSESLDYFSKESEKTYQLVSDKIGQGFGL